ncbi:AMP-binding protein [Alkalibacillus haloalkaliphilus]|uniref:Acyl-CoA synthetase n=1 Tax=Alkalibacillus haloalkaliphilus TaxID=94136 RepID=A0A511W3P4_9BACI|nr:AMP-binding protein [Alkalibacillus haloalkaliphilus]GEN45714.1 acyl-CoA synthetase [Alkalibacillus haloalkaliphilus]
MNITDSYAQHAEKHPSRPAIVTDDKTIYYREWEKIVRQTASAFSKEPAVHNRVAVFLPNGHLFLQVFAGASAAGWANVVGDMRWSQLEIETRLKEVEPDLIVADESMKDVFQNQDAKVIFSGEISEWVHNQDEWQSSEKANTPFYIGFTSGSTGQPKAFVRSHQSWVESFQCNQVDLGMTSEDQVLIPGSFVNSIFIYGALSTLYIGGTVYILNKFSTSRLMSVLEDNPISVVYVVPTMIHALINEGWKSVQQLTFISTGAKLLPSVKNEVKEHFPHASIYEFYGASELSFITVLNNDDQMTYADSVGKAFHNVEIKICGDDGKEVPSGEAGVLYVRSKMLFDGYLNNEEETDNVFDGEWATVHDIAKKDENGFIYILGRKNDMILYGGINIYPQEIEEVLKGIESVEEVAVFGAKDAYWGEKVAAYIKGDVTIRELKSYCLDYLPAYKIPRIWRKVDHFPYTSGGKISRKEIKKWLEEEKHEESRNR